MTDDERYLAAAHAMQSGVAAEMAHEEMIGTPPTTTATSPKHLRVGVNVALRDAGSLVALLISKGVITDAEYRKAIADGMEEVRRYEATLSELYEGHARLTGY